MPNGIAKRYGTDEAIELRRKVALGPLSFLLEREGVRGLSWRGIEVVRAISAPLRDENWGTIRPQNIREEVDKTSSSFRVTRHAEFLGGQLGTETVFAFSADGTVVCTFALSAGADVRVNRAGFTILHPVNGIAGGGLRVRHGSGAGEEMEFPTYISPAQPIFDIVGLSHQVETAQVSFDFEGDVFEMEDQRNWSDASYKTYCRPLGLPFPFEIAKGEVVRQTVLLRVSDAQSPGVGKPPPSAGPAQPTAPDILLAAQGDWVADADLCANGVVLRLGHGHAFSGEALRALAGAAQRSQAYIDAELVLDGYAGASAQIERLAARLAKAGIFPSHVTALPEAYLKSYQPTGPWPDGLTPQDCAGAARAAFPKAQIGVGSLTNFTELNRCQPRSGLGDYITHGNGAIVHAADDLSVVQTLETLPQIFASGHQIAGGREYRLGLVAIAMRTNPYGAALADNPDKIRTTMTGDDPRQRGLFGAAYAIAATAMAAGSGIGAISLAGAGGPFAVRDGDTLFPIYHALKALTAIAGRQVRVLENAGNGLVGLRFDGGMILANCSSDPVDLADIPGTAAVLDVEQFQAASTDRKWLKNATKTTTQGITLGAFACLFAGVGAQV